MCLFISPSMNTLTSKCKIKKYFQCNKEHSKSNDAKVKKEIPFSQTTNANQTTSLKQLSNFLKHLRFTSIEWDL